MAVQTKILKRTFSYEVPRYDSEGNLQTVQTEVATGSLVGGTPGQIADVAYGPVVHTISLPAAADIGTFVAGQGVIINSPEYANYGVQGAPLQPSLNCPAQSVVSVMTAGHVWVKRSALAAIQAGMYTYVIYEPPVATVSDSDSTAVEGSDNDLCIVEVNGIRPDNGSNAG